MPKTFQNQNNKKGKTGHCKKYNVVVWILKMFHGQQSCLYEGMDVCGISLSITLSPQVFPVKKGDLKKKQNKTKKEDTSRIKNDFSMCLKVFHFFR